MGTPGDSSTPDVTCTGGAVCAGDLLVCNGPSMLCGWGCLTTPSPHCGVVVPSGGGVGSADTTGGSTLVDVTLDSGTIDSESGQFGNARAGSSAPVGVMSGIDFELRGTNVRMFRVRSLKIIGNMQLVGTHAIAIVATDGDIEIDAVVDARGPCGDGAGTVQGPGGFPGGIANTNATGSGAGGGGHGNTTGGGGGGYGSSGGYGGSGGSMNPGDVGGSAGGDDPISVLWGGGGGGGAGGGGGGSGGGGGGALQLVANTQIVIGPNGGINAGGCGGFNPNTMNGGGGGGAGGTILLEAPVVRINGTLAANGGGGAAGDIGGGNGQGGQLGSTPANGGSGLLTGDLTANGGSGGAGSMLGGQSATTLTCAHCGGGGGAVGRIRLNTRAAAAILDPASVVSPDPLAIPTTTTQGTPQVQ